MSLNYEVQASDSLEVIQNGIGRVKEAFIRQGRSSDSECLAGCIGLIYCIVENGQSALFRYITLLHGQRFIGEPIAGEFQDHYMVICEDQLGRCFAASPANFNISDQKGVEAIQAENHSSLQGQIQEKIGGYWPPLYTERYTTPEIIEQNGRISLRVMVGLWDCEGSGYVVGTQPVDLFTSIKNPDR